MGSSEMNYLEWEDEEEKGKIPTFAEWKKQFEKKNKIDSNAETIAALDKTFKLNRYSVVHNFCLKVRVINITKFQGYLIINFNDSEGDLLTALFRDDNSFHFQVGSVYRLKRGQKAPSKLYVNTWVTTGPFVLLIHPPVELLHPEANFTRLEWFDYVTFPVIRPEKKDSAINVVGLVCPFMQDHYVTLVDENQNELNIYLGRAIEERFKEEQLSVWSVVSLKGLRLKGRDATSSVSSAIRIETCDDSVLQVNPDCPEANRIKDWMQNNKSDSNNNSRHDRSA